MGIPNGTFNITASPYKYCGDERDLADNSSIITVIQGQITTHNFILQKGGVIKGKVTDQNKIPIAGAFVSTDGPSYGYTYTSTDGNYTITKLQAGTYVVRAYPPSGIGLVGNSTSADVSVGQTTSNVDIVLLSNKPPIVSFSYSPENPLANQTITFNASNSTDRDGNITNYKWNFGDGTNRTGEIVTHSYTSAGTYNVTLTVTDNDGATNTSVERITVSNLPDLVITNTWMNWPDNCTICYNVTNIGNEAASAGHNTTLFVNGVEKTYDHVDAALEPDASYTGCFYGYNWTYTPPNENVTVCADCNNTVEESNETNNCLTTIWMCGDVNCDEAVDMSDVIDLLYYVGYPGNYTICSEWSADGNGDGAMDMSDVRALLYYVGYPGQYELNCCK